MEPDEWLYFGYLWTEIFHLSFDSGTGCLIAMLRVCYEAANAAGNAHNGLDC